MLTTTRLVYQSSNKKLSNSLYQILFARDWKGDRYRLGDLVRLAKNNTSASRTNTLKFALLGDPAITLAYGENRVITESINNKDIANHGCSIKYFDFSILSRSILIFFLITGVNIALNIIYMIP